MCVYKFIKLFTYLPLFYVEMITYRSYCCFPLNPTLSFFLPQLASATLHCFLFPCAISFLFITLAAPYFPVRPWLSQN